VGCAAERPAKVAISESGVQLTIDLWQIDPRFHGDLSLHFPMALPNDVVASLRSPSLAFR
jgi:hypothetical protein